MNISLPSKTSISPDCFAKFFCFAVQDTKFGTNTFAFNQTGLDKVVADINATLDLEANSYSSDTIWQNAPGGSFASHQMGGRRYGESGIQVDQPPFVSGSAFEVNDPFPVNKVDPPGIVYDGKAAGQAPAAYMAVNEIILHSDILSCSVSKSKGQAGGAWEMTLAPGNIDYRSAVHPGDHVLIFMKTDRDLGAISDQINNSYNSGLKCYGVVTSVRRNVSASPDGTISTRFIISGEDFGHFYETEVYYDAILAEALGPSGSNNLEIVYQSLGGLGNINWVDPGANVKILLGAYLGNNRVTSVGALAPGVSPNAVFQVPPPVAAFFGIESDQPNLASLITQQIGVMSYSDTQFDPTIVDHLKGSKFLQINPGQPFPLWSILQSYSNSALNEMFCSLRATDTTASQVPSLAGQNDSTGPAVTSPAAAAIVPTFLLRQFPFNSDNGAIALQRTRQLSTTTFSSLPRWTLQEDMLFSESTGRSEALRFNYLQLHGLGLAPAGVPATGIQTRYGNFAMDRDSISRYGLHTFIAQTSYDLVTGSQSKTPSFDLENPLSVVGDWIRLYADWYLNNHLLLTGQFESVGIQEPISIGDNLEIARPDGTTELYHIESLHHSFAVEANGVKHFRTNAAVTRGYISPAPLIRPATNVTT